MRPIGLLGGTFNPIHIGHLRLAEEALEQLTLDKIVFIPCALPPHKGPNGLAPARDRLSLVRLAIQGHPQFEVSDIEVRRGGRSYTVETLRALKRRWGARTELVFIGGADALHGLPHWRQAREILTLCRFAVARRPGFSLPRHPRSIASIEMEPLEVEASTLRALIRRGRSIRYLVPERVRMAIERRNLYR